MTTEALDWYPKRFAPGDMDGTTNENLLGQTELSPLEILIRETAQNSWDARLPGVAPEFGVRLRSPDPRVNERLAALLPMGHSEDFGRQLENPSLLLLEIHDRGTAGLDGPVDMEPVPEGEPKNFEDLIFKVGVPRGDGQGGGTFGFGKTAAFNYSSLGTVVYWTRCRDSEGNLEHRFIASAFRPSYDHHGSQYTGRHWWGRTREGKILPLQGESAQELGESLFVRKFEGEETGTSLLILGPAVQEAVREDEEPPEGNQEARSSDGAGAAPEVVFVEQIARAMRRHLWPKLVPLPGTGDLPMTMKLWQDGAEKDLLQHADGALALWGRALDALRRTGEQTTTPQELIDGTLRTEVIPLTRYQDVMGHLAIVHRILPLAPVREDDDLDPADPDNDLGRVALMRGSTELVVANKAWGEPHPVLGQDWLGVFRSVPTFDPVFAAAEPPAHDDWTASGSKPEVKWVVTALKKRAGAEIKKALGVAGYRADISNAPRIRTGGLARRFGTLLPPVGAEERGGSPQAQSRTPGKRTQRWRTVSQTARFDGTSADGAQLQLVEFMVDGPGHMGEVTLRVSEIGDQGLSHSLETRDLRPEWRHVARVTGGGSGAQLAPRQPASVRFRAPHRRALRIDLLVKGAE